MAVKGNCVSAKMGWRRVFQQTTGFLWKKEIRLVNGHERWIGESMSIEGKFCSHENNVVVFLWLSSENCDKAKNVARLEKLPLVFCPLVFRLSFWNPTNRSFASRWWLILSKTVTGINALTYPSLVITQTRLLMPSSLFVTFGPARPSQDQIRS